jgi:MFS family permease
MFAVGLGVFTVASLAVGLSPSPWTLIAAQAVQGAGGAVLARSTLALLSTSFPEARERPRAVALLRRCVGASLGLVLGGVLTSWLSWRVGFFVNVPIGDAMMLAAPRYLPKTERRPRQARCPEGFVVDLGHDRLGLRPGPVLFARAPSLGSP